MSNRKTQQRSRHTTFTKANREGSSLARSWWGIPIKFLATNKFRLLLLGALSAAALILQGSPGPTYANALDWSATEIASSGKALLFAIPGQGVSAAKRIAHKPAADLAELDAELDNQSNVTATKAIPAGCEIAGLNAAPRGPWVALELACGRGHASLVQVAHAVTGEVKAMGAELGSHSLFLGWSPTGNEVIVRADMIGDSQVYLIHVASGKTIPLNVPMDTYNVAISQNGKRMVYSWTRGLGFGSETWVANIDGGHARQVSNDPTQIIAYARFSPNGDKLAYIRMPDSNIPFTVGELWVMNADGSGQTKLAPADAGHGYAPDWSPDSQHIAFVYRENGSDTVADQFANRLESNIFAANLITGVVQRITKFTGTLAEAPVWSPDGVALAFSARPTGGKADVWLVSSPGQPARKVTQKAEARYPTWTSGK